jgi:hypothetical protein
MNLPELTSVTVCLELVWCWGACKGICLVTCKAFIEALEAGCAAAAGIWSKRQTVVEHMTIVGVSIEMRFGNSQQNLQADFL